MAAFASFAGSRYNRVAPAEGGMIEEVSMVLVCLIVAGWAGAALAVGLFRGGAQYYRCTLS